MGEKTADKTEKRKKPDIGSKTRKKTNRSEN